MEVFTTSVLVLPYTASSVGVARRGLMGDLLAAGVHEGAASDAGLVISELISNALRHASPLPGCSVRVGWRLGDGSLELEVSDGGGPTTPTVHEPAGSSVGGRGLGIVERLALRWGVAGTGGETTVWAELPVRYGGEGRLVGVSGTMAAREA